jgi:ATP-binding cassette, subfamily B, bacterial PglK
MKSHLILRALKLIPKPLRSKGVYLVILLSVGTILDLFSLASFLPVIALTLDSTRELPMLTNLVDASDRTSMVRVLTLAALSLLVLKTFFNSFVTRRKADYAYQVGQQLAEASLTHYFAIPYRNYSTVDFAGEMNRISNAPLTFANNFIIPLGTLFAEVITGSMLILAAAIYKPAVFLVLIVTVPPLAIVYQRIRARIKRSTADVKSSYPLLLKHTLQSVEGLTEIRSFRKESFFQQRFAESFRKVSRVFTNDHTVHTASSRITELVAGVCICAVVFFLSFSASSTSDLVLILSIYATISFRMIPSINRILSSLVQMRTHEHIIDSLSLSASAKTTFTEPEAQLTFKQKIELIDVSFDYGNGAIMTHASLTIHKNERIILHGKSGSGKTTGLLMLLGLLRPSSGTIKVDGINVHAGDSGGLHRIVGYVPQNPFMMDGSIAENIAFGVRESEIDENKIHWLLEQLDLATWVKSLPQGMNWNIGENGNKISGGQRQRIAIARALYHDAQVLLMDEVTNQLDKNTELEVMKALASPVMKEKTLVLVTHRPEIWESFDTVYELKNGKFEAAVVNEIQL